MWRSSGPGPWERGPPCGRTGPDARPVEGLSSGEVGHRWPQVGLDAVAWALFEPEAGFLLARRGIAQVARQFGREGGAFRLARVRPGRVDGRRLLDVVDDMGARLA